MFYDNYVRLCNSVGKTPSAVATEIGIQKSTVTRWSKGSTPNRATAMKIADYFCVPVDALSSESNWEAFGLNLDYYLEGSDISPERLAEAVGVEVSVVYDWMNHKKYPKADVIKQVAAYLDLGEDNLCENKSVNLTASDWFVAPAWMSEDDAVAIKKFLKLSPEQQKIIGDTMDNFLKG